MHRVLQGPRGRQRADELRPAGPVRGTTRGAMSKVCIVPHLGLGDMIILNGMVRVVCQANDEVMLFAKKAYVNSIRSLFHGIPNLRMKFVDECHEFYANDCELIKRVVADMGYALLPMGVHTSEDWRSLDDIWSRALYRQVGLDPDLMYSEFHVSRNQDREAMMLATVHKAVGMAYVVVHDDPARDFVIDRACLPPGLPVVHVDDKRWRSDNIFDYIQVIDNSVQFHGFDSCFMLLADFLHLGARNFCHAYFKDADMPQKFYRTGVTVLRAPPMSAGAGGQTGSDPGGP